MRSEEFHETFAELNFLAVKCDIKFNKILAMID